MNSKKKILLIGSNGFLGAALSELLKSSMTVVALDRTQLDLGKPLSHEFLDFFKREAFHYVIMCAAITDVEKCFQNRELSHQINVTGTMDVFELAKHNGVIPVFFSSDYVFSGKLTPYEESDLPNPLTIYGQQKLIIENYLKDNFRDYLIFRTSKLMSKNAHPKNILIPMITNLKAHKVSRCFEDQYLNPVFIEDIAEVLKLAILQKLTGLFHLGTRRVFTRAELGRFIAKTMGADFGLIESIRMSEIKFSEIRPTNNSLNCQKIEKALDFSFAEVEESIIENLLKTSSL